MSWRWRIVRRALATPRAFHRPRNQPFRLHRVALFDPSVHPRADDMLDDAEIAMRNAKRAGGNCIECSAPRCARQRSDPWTLEADLAPALWSGAK